MKLQQNLMMARTDPPPGTAGAPPAAPRLAGCQNAEEIDDWRNIGDPEHLPVEFNHTTQTVSPLPMWPPFPLLNQRLRGEVRT